MATRHVRSEKRLLGAGLSALAVAAFLVVAAGNAFAVQKGSHLDRAGQIVVVQPNPMPAGCGHGQCWCDRTVQGDCELILGFCNGPLACDYRGFCQCESLEQDPIIFLE